MQLAAKREYWLISGLLFFFFFSWSSSYSLFSIWLHRVIGLNGTETGFIFAANAIAALLVQPFYGALQDRLGLSKKLLVWIGILLCAAAPFAIYVYAGLLAQNVVLGALVGAAFLALAMLAGVGVIESYTERLSRHAGFEFGTTRMWGSLGWASATGVVGVVFNIDPDIAFYMSSAAGVVFLLILSRLDLDRLNQPAAQAGTIAHPVRLNDLWKLLTLPRFWAFSLYLTGVCGIYMIYEQQFPVYFSSFFPTPEEGTRAYGYLNSSQVLVEAVLMLFAPWVVSRTGAKYGLILAGSIMFVRILGSGMATQAWAIAACKMLHALEVPILLVSIFKYISLNFDSRLSASIYLVGFQFAQQLTAMLLSPLVGYGYDHFGFSSVYVLMAGLVGVCLLLSWTLLRKDPVRGAAQDLPGDSPELPAIAQSALRYEP
ncbi:MULTISPECIES: MFS transporter [Pseudomonas chlororaphis group]|uniref:MFS transporter n=1 Tax=Pseudomonas chlororaphis group TaxID=136842 RepID=UPI0020976596|nr:MULTISPECIES: MFS transporter [Pseudomonas chlororaphis group]MCO7577411.1 MFS transporter [Pseudomonas protegens]MCO7583873.1 MFS transporter [Pseudomonas chlororaphis]MCO7600794.1 MFS transporter [Pseudomonas chlororaphis]MCY7259457.1 MFS transporter [Pseudomonas protegens]